MSSYEVASLLVNLKRKASGPDGTPYWVFKQFPYVFSDAISMIFNRSFKTGCVPLCFKKADVTPIPKRSNPSELSHFRPISLLPTLSKVLEKLFLRKCLLPHISSQLHKSQFAYRPGAGGGCCSALTLIQHKILNFLDHDSGAVRLMAVDFAKAFEKVTHVSIINACVDLQVPDNTISWTLNFLSDRWQRVRVESEASSWKACPSGVPQGSVLGPILFTMVMDSLQPLSENTAVVKYADDVTFLHFVRSSSEDKLQSEWNHLTEWSEAHNLPLNTSKSRVMNVITRKNLTLCPIFYDSFSSLEEVNDLPLLGLTLSSDLKWNVHVNNIVKKASKRFFVLYNLKRANSPPHIMWSVYCSVIRSCLLYAYPAFCNLPLYLKDKLHRVEKRALRIMAPCNLNSPTSIFEAGDRLCHGMFCAILSRKGHPLRELFDERDPGVTRAGQILKPPFARTKRFKESFIKFAS